MTATGAHAEAVSAALARCSEFITAAARAEPQPTVLLRSGRSVAGGAPATTVGGRSLFRAFRAPFITLPDYLSRFATYGRCGDDCFLMAFILVDRLLRCGEQLSAESAHRLIAISVVVTAKLHYDEMHSNTYWAQLCGLSLGELNHLEEELLKRLDWMVAVTPQELAACTAELLGQDPADSAVAGETEPGAAEFTAPAEAEAPNTPAVCGDRAPSGCGVPRSAPIRIPRSASAPTPQVWRRFAAAPDFQDDWCSHIAAEP
eukprot:TRINITY_DN70049_c0_g1_i1.p1 TRINITY_DN70049_c0_g1~~TRINITY_DN70049_c0_g1_i1.p1  ORF type:complete len:260 (+),score=80.15 TRINITY_DN70049_c0_g1_i1:75-854(+)